MTPAQPITAVFVPASFTGRWRKRQSLVHASAQKLFAKESAEFPDHLTSSGFRLLLAVLRLPAWDLSTGRRTG
jgi:hypothetical protein